MLTKLKPKSDFSRNVLTLMTGTTIAQAIPIAISPILTRLYTPEDFGVLALFVAITSIFGSIANGRYELAIMLPKKDEDAINILALGFIINVFVSLCLLIIIFIFHCKIVNLLNNQEISPWLYLVPISVFLMGCFNLLNYYNNRKKYYKDLAKANVFKSIGSAIVQLLLGFLKGGAIGLISGQIFAQIISNTKLFLNIKKDNLFVKIKKVKIIALAKRYRKFPIFDTFVAVISIFYTRLMIFVLYIFYTANSVGMLFFAEKLIQVPISFIKTSISNVFFEKISKLKKEDIFKECNELSYKIFKLTFIPFLIFIFSSKWYCPIVFGDKWQYLNLYIVFLSIPVYISFLMSPFSYVLKIINKQEVSLFFHFIKLLVLLLFVLIQNFNNLFEFVFYFTIIDGILMLFFLSVQIYYLIGKNKINFIHLVFFILLVFEIIYLKIGESVEIF